MADGKTIYNIAFRCIDYCKDLQKNTGSYNEYFSPNNIRRLIISPDVVAAEFYINVPNIGTGTLVRIPMLQLMQLCQNADYWPMVGVLATDRVCSSVEEVVFLLQDNSYNYQLSPAEYSLVPLAGKNFANKDMETVVAAVKRRFVRLRMFTQINCSWNDFHTVKRDRNTFVGENPVFQNRCQITMVHDEKDWYKNWGSASAAKFYPTMDGVGGHLWTYFKNDLEKRKRADKSADVDEFTKKKVTALTEDFNRQYKNFLKLAKLQVKFSRTLSKLQPEDGITFDFPRLELQKFYDCDANMLKSHIIDPPSGLSPRQIVSDNMERLKGNMVSISNYFTEGYYNALKVYMNKYPICTKAMLKGAEATIIPSNDMLFMARLAQEFGYTCNGKNVLMSSINVCCNYIMFFARRDSNLEHEFVRPSYWKEA